jgi:hypothetical protein
LPQVRYRRASLPADPATKGGNIRRALPKSSKRSAGRYLYPPTSARASSPQPSVATKRSSLNGRLTCVGLIICIPSASRTLETTRSMTRNGK